MTAEVDGRVASDRSELIATIVHSSPGRLRLRIGPDDIDGDALARAERAFADTRGVQEVTRSGVTHSVLLRFDPDLVTLPGLLGAAHGAGVDVKLEEPAAARPSAVSDATLGDAIGGFFTSADDRVREALGGKADLRTLVPIGLGVLALREVLAGRMTGAPWFVLAWYAFDSFNKLHRNQKSTDSPQA